MWGWETKLLKVFFFFSFPSAVMVTTSNPWSVSEAERFQSLILTSLLNQCPFKGFKCALCLVKMAKRRCSNHSEDPKRLPSRRVLEAAGKTETSIRTSQSPEHAPPFVNQHWWWTHKQMVLYKSESLKTFRKWAEKMWGTDKTDKPHSLT